MSHRRFWIASLLVLGLLVLVQQVRAVERLQGDECIVDADETIDTDIYVACNTLTVEGTITGDLIGGVWSALIAEDGRVEGDVWLVGGQLRIDGAVDDDVRFAGVDLDLAETIELQDSSDVTAVALNVEVWQGAVIPGDLSVLGYQTIIQGRVEDNVNFNGSALVVTGMIEDDVFATVGGGDTAPSFIPIPFPFSVSFQTPGMTIEQGGQVGGNLNYAGPEPGNIDGRVGGETNFELNLPRPDLTQAALEEEQVQAGEVIARYLRTVLTDVLALLAAGLLVMFVAPAWLHEPATIARRRTATSFSWGMMLALLAAPMSIMLVLVSILVLVLIAVVTLGGFTWMGLVLLLMVNFVLIGGAYFVIIFLSRLVIVDMIGRRLGRRFIQNYDRTIVNLLSLVLGAIIYTLITNIPLPWIGLVVNAIGIFAGLGAIALHARQLYQRTIRVVYPVAPVTPAVQPRPSPAPRLEALRGNTPEPPPDSNELPGPGLSNLPAGFRWWRSEADEEEE